MKKTVGAIAFLSLCAVQAASVSPLAQKYLTGVWAGNSNFSIPQTSEIPQIDGKIDENEWSDAVQICGFSAKNRLVPERSGFAALKTDGKYLYCLVRTSAKNNDPGGGLVTRASGRDSAVYDDDSLEFVFSRGGGADAIHHLIFNDNCALFDRKVMLNPRNIDVKWNIQDYKAQSITESGWWTFEAKFALSEICGGARNFKLNIARNWSGFGPSALNNSSKHTDLKKAFSVVSGKALPAVQIDDIPAAAAGEWNIGVTGINSTSRKLSLAVMIREFSWPRVKGKVKRTIRTVFSEEKTVMPGQRTTISGKYIAGNHIHYMSVVLFDPVSKRVYFSRLIVGKKEIFTGRHPVSGTFTVPGFGNGLFRHYPGYNKAVFEITPSGEASGRKMQLMVNGKAVKINSKGRKLEAVIPLEKRVSNVTAVVTRADGKSEKKVIAKITGRKWKWQGHNYGKERVLLEPFTKISKKGDDTIATLRCQYRFAPSGLPGNIAADGKDIFASIPESEMVVDGKTVRFNSGSVKTTVAADGLDARIFTEAQAGGITLKTDIHSEYDNFNIHTMRLSGVAGKKISRWTIRFPFKKQEAWLFHAVSNMIRRNPSGRIPQGNGCVWDASKLYRANAFGQETLHPALVPYIWLGGLERGMAWFFDSSLGMKVDRKKMAVRIVRSKDKVVLEIDLINRPVTLKEGHKIEFGTQATPVKPIDRRIVQMTFDAVGDGVPGSPNALTISEHILGYPYRWAKVPLNEDWSLFETMVKAAASTDKSAAFPAVEKYMKKYGKKFYQLYLAAGASVKSAKRMEEIRKNYLHLNFGKKRASIPMKYSDPRLAYTADPETKYFEAEWFNPSPQNYMGGLRTTLTPSYMDFIIYGYAKEFDHGMKGCYLDDTFIMPEINPHTTASVDDEGEVHCNTGIFAMRELIKRISVLQHLKGMSPRILQVHMTNAQVIPAFSFATSQLGWESDFGEKPLQLRYKDDLILAESTGLQVGNAAFSLGGIVRKTTTGSAWKRKFEQLSRTLMAMTMPYGVGVKLRASPQDANRKVVLAAQAALSKFGIGKQGCVFEPFFDPAKAPKEISGDELMISAYSKGGKKLMIIGNRGDKMQQFRINGKFSAVNDYETGKPLAAADRQVKPYDFRLIELIR